MFSPQFKVLKFLKSILLIRRNSLVTSEFMKLGKFSSSFNQLNNSIYLQNFLAAGILSGKFSSCLDLKEQILKQIHSQITIYKSDIHKLFPVLLLSGLVWDFFSWQRALKESKRNTPSTISDLLGGQLDLMKA